MPVSTLHTRLVMSAALVCAATIAVPAAAQDAAASPVEIKNGTASFDVDTNVPALSVHGKSSALEGHVTVHSSAEGPQLEKIEAKMPVQSLGTGLKLRDDHMRKYVFTTSDGQVPDVRFVADKASCTKASGRQSTCQVAGDLVIRGTARPFSIALKVTEDNGSFHASGDSIVKLSSYGIERPSQLGVSTVDDVKLRLEFTARPGAVATSGVTR